MLLFNDSWAALIMQHTKYVLGAREKAVPWDVLRLNFTVIHGKNFTKELNHTFKLPISPVNDFSYIFLIPCM